MPTPAQTTVRLLIFALLALGAAPGARAAEVSDQDVATVITDTLATGDPLTVEGVTLDGTLVRALYADRGGAPLWRGREEEIAKALSDAASEGLDPASYHVAALVARPSDDSARAVAARDLVLSDALLRYAADVRYGHARPTRVTAEVAVGPEPVDAVALVRQLAGASDVRGALSELPPRHPTYVALRAALERYRAAFAEGKRWPVVPDGPTLRPGTSDPAVPALRERLAATGELEHEAANGSRSYDPTVVAAVKVFQDSHALGIDGVVGPKARVALNVGLATRIEQMIANMERWRWLPADLGPRYVKVNIAAQRLAVVEDGRTVLTMPVIVGQTDKMTPMFSSEITQIVWNPPWRVPDTIARRELLPKVQRDGSYFAREGIRLVGTWQPGPSEEDPEAVSWADARHAAGFRLRQDPGPQNPLGRVKFHIPNVFGVYLHDTNSKRLFAKEQRTLSHGCVRVGNALGLAEHLLEASPSWSEERQARVLSAWKTVAVPLADPIPVHLVYESAWVDAADNVYFAEDVYGRDRRLADRLAGRGGAREESRPQVAQP